MIDKEDKDSNLHIALEMISRVECIREFSKFAIERVDYYNALADKIPKKDFDNLEENSEEFVALVKPIYMVDQYLGFVKYLTECGEDANVEMKKVICEIHEKSSKNNTNA